MREEKVEQVEVVVDPVIVTLTASMRKRYTGTCYVEISQPDGSNYERYVEPLDNSISCMITIFSSSLSAGKTWEYQMGFYTEDGKVKGAYPRSSFTL